MSPSSPLFSRAAVFFFPIFHLWWPTAISSVLLIGVLIFWLWTGTAAIPEKESKDIGLGLTLPLYASGSSSVGWWAMFITMLADMTAFVSLVFGYFFFWTIHRDFPPDPAPGPGLLWPSAAVILVLSAWALTMVGRRWNRGGKRRSFLVALAAAAIAAVAGGAALVAGPWTTGLDPTMDVYAATVWVLVIWTAFHVAIGIDHVALLHGGRSGWPRDRAVRHRRRQRGALLAFRRRHQRDHRGRRRGISARRVRTADATIQSTAKACGF